MGASEEMVAALKGLGITRPSHIQVPQLQRLLSLAECAYLISHPHRCHQSLPQSPCRTVRWCWMSTVWTALSWTTTIPAAVSDKLSDKNQTTNLGAAADALTQRRLLPYHAGSVETLAKAFIPRL